MEDAGRAARIRRTEISQTLVDRLEAIASPSRLRLLAMLAEPRRVSEIEIAATNQDGDERNITTQGVRHHLNKLRQTGFVEANRVDEGGVHVNEYVADHRRLYEIGEVLRSMPLALASPPEELGAPPTWEEPSSTPSLTVVHGAEIGRSFPLRGEPNFSGRGWVLGSDERADVALDWDSFVGRQAAEIERDRGQFRIIDLRATSRRVSLNGQALDRGESRDLTDGDLIGIGRSLLVFHE